MAVTTLVMRPETVRERERNLMAIAMQADDDTACRIILELTPEELVEPHARWLQVQIAERIGKGHTYHDLLAVANAEQAAYLDDLHSRYVSAGNADELLTQVKQQSQLRRAREVFAAGLEKVKQGEVGAIEAGLSGLAQILVPSTARRIHDAYAILTAARKRIEAMRAGKLARYMPLGMPFIERSLAIQPGQLVIMAAGTGVGKTALALTWTHAVAFAAGEPVLYLNSEMAPDEIGLRLAAIAEGLHLGRLRVSPTLDDLRTVERMAERDGNKPAFTSEPVGELTSAEVAGLTRYHRTTSDIRLLVVDYIQRLRDFRAKDVPQWQMLMEISRALKVLAADQRIVVLCLAQFNSMGELAASKGMANDADLVLGLERCGKDGPAAELAGQTHVLTVVKGRHIATGLRFRLRMDTDTLRFTEQVRPEELPV